jgi:hypothetical protein
MAWTFICDDSDLALECASAGETVGLEIATIVTERWFEETSARIGRGDAVAIALVAPPSLEQLVSLAKDASTKSHPVAFALVGEPGQTQRILDAAGDLGLFALSEVRPLIALVALLSAGATGATAPWLASIRSLPALDRARLKSLVSSAQRLSKGQFHRQPDGLLAWSPEPGSPFVRLGETRDVACAIASARAAERSSLSVESSVEGVEQSAVLEVIFGPRRALSDPASKAALAFYGLAMPVEELCLSASRAAAEASRIGFPVRVSLASPDLRVWDHPDLVVDLIDNAARVREVFGSLMALAKVRASESRLLGVTVTAANPAVALLQVRARPLLYGRVSMDVGFGDPHGMASADVTTSILPASLYAIERALGRLRGSDLILGGPKARRRRNLELISDTLLRLAAFINDRVKEVESVELLPLALLADGGVEVREACVAVSDSFERSINTTVGPYQERSASL